MLLLPFPILSFVPNFFFGSLLTLICVDLLFEWLWDVRHRLTPVEYVICLATLGLIQVLGVEYGILVGVALYVSCRKLGLNVGELKIATGVDVEKEMQEERQYETSMTEPTTVPAAADGSSASH